MARQNRMAASIRRIGNSSQGGQGYQRRRNSSRSLALLRETGAVPNEKPIETSTSARASANITRVGPQGSPIPDTRVEDCHANDAVMQLCERVPASVQVCPNGNRIRNLIFREEM